jgi:hypothetical protein
LETGTLYLLKSEVDGMWMSASRESAEKEESRISESVPLFLDETGTVALIAMPGIATVVPLGMRWIFVVASETLAMLSTPALRVVFASSRGGLAEITICRNHFAVVPRFATDFLSVALFREIDPTADSRRRLLRESGGQDYSANSPASCWLPAGHATDKNVSGYCGKTMIIADREVFRGSVTALHGLHGYIVVEADQGSRELAPLPIREIDRAGSQIVGTRGIDSNAWIVRIVTDDWDQSEGRATKTGAAALLAEDLISEMLASCSATIRNRGSVAPR